MSSSSHGGKGWTALVEEIGVHPGSSTSSRPGRSSPCSGEECCPRRRPDLGQQIFPAIDPEGKLDLAKNALVVELNKMIRGDRGEGKGISLK